MQMQAIFFLKTHINKHHGKLKENFQSVAIEQLRNCISFFSFEIIIVAIASCSQRGLK